MYWGDQHLLKGEEKKQPVPEEGGVAEMPCRTGGKGVGTASPGELKEKLYWRVVGPKNLFWMMGEGRSTSYGGWGIGSTSYGRWKQDKMVGGYRINLQW